jgi:amino acid permease
MDTENRRGPASSNEGMRRQESKTKRRRQSSLVYRLPCILFSLYFLGLFIISNPARLFIQSLCFDVIITN